MIAARVGVGILGPVTHECGSAHVHRRQIPVTGVTVSVSLASWVMTESGTGNGTKVWFRITDGLTGS